MVGDVRGAWIGRITGALHLDKATRGSTAECRARAEAFEERARFADKDDKFNVESV